MRVYQIYGKNLLEEIQRCHSVNFISRALYQSAINIQLRWAEKALCIKLNETNSR